MPTIQCAKINLDTACSDGLFIQVRQCYSTSMEVNVCCVNEPIVLGTNERIVLKSDVFPNELIFDTNPFTMTLEDIQCAAGAYNMLVCLRDVFTMTERTLVQGIISVLSP